MPSIADRLQEARNQLFVGRQKELERFRSVLATDPLSVNVLHVFGPGGVGKTSLLQAFERVCHEQEVSAASVDARDVEPTPEAFRRALRRAVGLDADESVLSALAAQGDRSVLLVDTYETVEALDGWLRNDFLPDLPGHVLLVLAGRNEPAAEWRTDPGWQALVDTLSLRNFDAEAGSALLRRRGVPDTEHEAILNFTHGHPLATSLVADLLDQREDPTFDPEDAPDVVRTLLEKFLQEVPGPDHRAVLEAASLVRYATEAVLSAMLDRDDVHELFEWLRGLSFVTPGERGLTLHDLARDALAADLRWRHSERHDTLHERARQFYTDRLKHAADRQVPNALSDLTFLLRDHPLIQPFFDRLRSQWGEAHGLLENEATEDDWPALRDVVEAHEGEKSAQIAEHWFECQPEGVRVYRTPDGEPVGFMLTLALDAASEADRAADPVAERAWTYLEAHAPLRPGERASMFRFWMATDTYQDVSPVQSLVFIRQVRHYLHTSDLAFTVLVCRDPDTWGRLFGYADMERLTDDDVEVGPHTYALYGHDWRARPPGQWLDRLAERGFEVTSEATPETEDRVIVLSRDDFEDALTDAFKQLHRPDQLQDNPLLYARIVTNEVGSDADVPERIEALQALVEKTTERLAEDPRDEKYYHAVHRTYIKPAPTQETAAEQLGVPFSTFRRHLNRGLERVTEILWDDEVGTSP
jgi:hypothetical protein